MLSEHVCLPAIRLILSDSVTYRACSKQVNFVLSLTGLKY